MSLTILHVAYPLAPVAPDTAGGAEQVLLQLDRALVGRGFRSIVVASEGSRVAGHLIATPRPRGTLDENAKREAWRMHSAAIERSLAQYQVDVVHMHGIDFYRYLPSATVPVLVTLHLPVNWYPEQCLRIARPQTWFNCVSAAQQRTAPAGLALLPPIENGVDVGEFQLRRKRGFALFLGRICPEKGVHFAIDAAERAGLPLLLAGEVFPYESHRLYFETQIAPRLSKYCRFIGRVGSIRKRRLLATASCLLVPSNAEETSSLVAREALAAGTPVIAFARGALPDVVEVGRTGFLVEDGTGMADAIRRADSLDPRVCRESASRRFPLSRMIDRYMDAYRSISSAALAA